MSASRPVSAIDARPAVPDRRAGQAARVYLIDASIYVFRAWHVLPATLVAADGRPMNAVRGFVDFLAELHERVRPTYIAVCFDAPRHQSARHLLYPPYKANRDPAPAELAEQFHLCREITRAAGLPEFADPRFEADDLIATLAGMATTSGHPVTVVTADKDLAQVITDDDEWWDFARDRRLDARGVRALFGVQPDQIADMLALAGDRIDNIPGVPGIGPPTAARLLARWGDLETLYANLPAVAQMRFRGAARVARLLAEHEDTVRLARQLTGSLFVDGLPQSVDALRRSPTETPALDGQLATAGIGKGERDALGARLALHPGDG